MSPQGAALSFSKLRYKYAGRPNMYYDGGGGGGGYYQGAYFRS